MMHGDVEPDNGAVAPADQRGLVDLEKIHERERVGGHQIVTVRPRVARAAAVAPAVHDHDPVMRGHQIRHQLAPIIGIGEPAVEQDDRRAMAERGVPDLDAVDRRIAAFGGRRQAWRRRQREPLRLGARRPGKANQEKAENQSEAPHDFTASRLKATATLQVRSRFAISSIVQGAVVQGANVQGAMFAAGY